MTTDQKQIERLAIASRALAISSIVILILSFIILPAFIPFIICEKVFIRVFLPATLIAAVICGHVARSRIKKNPNSLRGLNITRIVLLMAYPMLAIPFISYLLSFMVGDSSDPREFNRAWLKDFSRQRASYEWMAQTISTGNMSCLRNRSGMNGNMPCFGSFGTVDMTRFRDNHKSPPHIPRKIVEIHFVKDSKTSRTIVIFVTWLYYLHYRYAGYAYVTDGWNFENFITTSSHAECYLERVDQNWFRIRGAHPDHLLMNWIDYSWPEHDLWSSRR